VTTNPFFNKFAAFNEQNLIENLCIEAIQVYGIDCYYMPRAVQDYDPIYGEDPTSEYNFAALVEMYIKNVEGFGGDGDFLSKFNIQIRDTMTFTVARRRWNTELGAPFNLPRPLEGDLIYFPLNGKTFQIKFVEHESIFYQMGALQVYDLKCELWEYSNERINTGIAILDNLTAEFSFALTNFNILLEDASPLASEDGFNLIQDNFNFVTQVGDPFENNSELSSEASTFIDFSETNPFAEPC
jgi:hypothetical protein